MPKEAASSLFPAADVIAVKSIWSAAIHRRLGRANSLARPEPS